MTENNKGALAALVAMLLFCALEAVLYARPIVQHLPAARALPVMGLLLRVGGIALGFAFVGFWLRDIVKGNVWLVPHLVFAPVATLGFVVGERDILELMLLGSSAMIGSLAIYTRHWKRICQVLIGSSVLTLVIVLAPAMRPRLPLEDTQPSTMHADADAPDIVVIVLDTVRRDRLATWGGRSDVGDFLDTLGASAAIFDNARASAPWSLPVHASLFTGRTPDKHGATWEQQTLPEDPEGTIAEVLARNGYATMAISANPWIVPGNGTLRGFHEAHTTGGAMAVERSFWIVRVFDVLFPGDGDKGGREVREAFRASWGTAQAQPRFAFVNIFEAHAPYNRIPQGREIGFKERIASARVDREHSVGVPIGSTVSVRDASIEAYDEAIKAADFYLKEIVQIVERDASRPVGIVVLSDHGELFGEHDFWGHHDGLWSQLLEVPLVVVPPNRADFTGQRFQHSVLVEDIPVTIARWAGIEGWGEGRDGRDLFDADEDRQRNRPAMHQLPTPVIAGLKAHGRKEEAARRNVRRRTVEADGWRYEVRSDGTEMLVQCSGVTNCGMEQERFTLDDSSVHASWRGQLEAAFGADAAGLLGPASPSQQGEGLDAGTLERLRALGYIE